MKRQAMIFAAGLGTRLRPLTDSRPKALVEVKGHPMLWHVVTKLRGAGVERIVVNVHHFSDMVKNIYHGIKPEFLQEYLNEFCYKFNRRYFGDKLFDRLMIASVACMSDFEHRIHNRNLSAGCG